MRSLLRWGILAFTLIFLWRLFANWAETPIVAERGTATDHGGIQDSKLPAKTWTHKGFRITNLESVKITGLVLSTAYYTFDTGAKISPMDLALGWGAMANPNILNYFDISQSDRHTYWYSQHMPIKAEEIARSLTNMHLIPANSAVYAELKRIKKNQTIVITGSLVFVEKEGWSWKSSLSRTDTGDGACEVVWVDGISILD